MEERKAYVRRWEHYELLVGPIPPDTPVLRHVVCRNPACCNPAHLKPGTKADNEHDKVADGTHNRGERHPLSKLAEAQVREIHRCAAAGEPRSAIARRFGVRLGTIDDIVTSRSWAWLKSA